MLAIVFSLLLASTPEAPDVNVAVTATPIDGDRWAVRYVLSEPVEALVFARDNGANRAESWTMESPGLAIEPFGGTERIVATDAGPFEAVSIVINDHGRKPDKDYAPFLGFSDGAVAIYTGQFIVGMPLSDEPGAFIDGADNGNTHWPSVARITVESARFEQLVARAQVLASPATLPLVEGEYVYLGSDQPVATESMTLIMDSATPAWLAGHLQRTLVDTFAYFTNRLGPLPDGKPFMLTTFRQLEGGAMSFSGGVILDQLAIQMGLGEAIEDTPEQRRFLARFFAHEAAHLWNNGFVGYVAPEDAWIHEGGAEALAWLALLDLGHDTREAVALRFTTAAQQCQAFLGAGPLIEAHRRGEFRAFYACGAIIALATHGAMRTHESDLAGFWAKLIDYADQAGGRYDANSYLAILGPYLPTLADRLTRFVAVQHPNPQTAVQHLLEAGGVGADVIDGELIIPALPGDRRSGPGR